MTTVARSVDLLALAFAFGSTAWFFVIQSAVLVKRMGRDRFMPLQMSLAQVLFKSLTVALLVMLGAAMISTGDLLSMPVLTATVAFMGAAINNFFVLPRALKTGAKSLKEEQPVEEQRSVANFVSQGGGQASRFWHRAVVFFVLVMFAGLLPHAASLASASLPVAAVERNAETHVTHSEQQNTAQQHTETPAETHGQTAVKLDSGKKWKANPETTEGVRAMLAIVRQAAARKETGALEMEATSRQLNDAYQDIFRRCTMTGAAHEQLHQFLIPLGQLLGRLQGSQAAVLQDMQAHLERYDTYFE